MAMAWYGNWHLKDFIEMQPFSACDLKEFQ